MGITLRVDQADVLRLGQFLRECIEDAEDRFGPRDEQYNFPQLRPRDDGGGNPYTDVSDPPNLTVFLPAYCFDGNHGTEARWHIAHESIHVLDPHCNPTNYLEEGLATWFQNQRVTEYTGVRWNPWAEAEHRVSDWMSVLPDAVKRLRLEQKNLRQENEPWTKLGDITTDLLVQYCGELGAAAHGLVEKFPAHPDPEEVES